MNGQKVGDRVLDPGWTEWTQTVLYAKYDVAPYLTEGHNAIGVMLGHGWYGSQQLLLQLDIEHDDGTLTRIVTGGSHCPAWQLARGPIIRNTVYDGEVYDARREQPGWDKPGFEPVGWAIGRPVESPGGQLRSQACEPIRVTQSLTPRTMTNPQPGVYVFDLGQNISGWARLQASGPAGTRITLRYAEVLYADGTVNQENLRAAAAEDVLILKGTGEEMYEPRFTYHGFRYVQMEGFPGVPLAIR